MAGKDSSGATRQMVLLLLLAVGVCAVIYLYYVSPMNEELGTVEQSIERLENEVAVARVQEARLPALMEQIREQEAKLQALRSVLPTSKETADIVRQVEQIAKQSNLRLKSFTPQETVQKDFYQDWPILLSVEGNFDTLGVFLERVGRFRRLINVENLAIRPLSEDERTQNRSIAATCTATTYVFEEVSDDS